MIFNGERPTHNYQKQPPIGVLIKKCYENMQQIYRKTLVLVEEYNNADDMLLAL